MLIVEVSDVVRGRTRFIMQLFSDVQSLQLIVEKCDQTSLLLNNH